MVNDIKVRYMNRLNAWQISLLIGAVFFGVGMYWMSTVPDIWYPVTYKTAEDHSGPYNDTSYKAGIFNERGIAPGFMIGMSVPFFVIAIFTKYKFDKDYHKLDIRELEIAMNAREREADNEQTKEEVGIKKAGHAHEVELRILDIIKANPGKSAEGVLNDYKKALEAHDRLFLKIFG